MKVQVKVNNMNRMKTKEIQIGDRVIGGENPILISVYVQHAHRGCKGHSGADPSSGAGRV